METFIKKLCSRYKVSEADVQSLLDCMEEVHFKKRELIVREGTKNSNLYFITTKTEKKQPSGSLRTERLPSPSGDM